jgi:hypothetical protein
MKERNLTRLVDLLISGWLRTRSSSSLSSLKLEGEAGMLSPSSATGNPDTDLEADMGHDLFDINV